MVKVDKIAIETPALVKCSGTWEKSITIMAAF
jgi:hypothetical protein